MSTAVADELDAENPLVEGLERLPVHPTALVIFGATGDLAHRKLLPALYNLAHEGSLPERFELIGIARSEHSDEEFRKTGAASRSHASPAASRTRTCSMGCSVICATSPGASTRSRSTSASSRRIGRVRGAGRLLR